MLAENDPKRSGRWEGDVLRRDFERERRREVPPEFRVLLDVATEVHVRHGLGPRGAEGQPEWERLRSALFDLRREGYVAEEWSLERES